MAAPPHQRRPPTGQSRDAPRGPPGDERGGDRGGERGFRAPQQNDRRRMLDLRREGHLKYDLRDVLSRSSLASEQQATFVATVLSKGSRQSTGEAKDWVTAKMNEGIIARNDRDAINTLLDRYSKWR